MRDGVIIERVAFHASSCPKYVVGQIGRAIYTTTFTISGGTTGRRFRGRMCAEEALHCVYRKRNHTKPEKVRLCITLSLFLWDKVEVVFGSFSATSR